MTHNVLDSHHALYQTRKKDENAKQPTTCTPTHDPANPKPMRANPTNKKSLAFHTKSLPAYEKASPCSRDLSIRLILSKSSRYGELFFTWQPCQKLPFVCCLFILHLHYHAQRGKEPWKPIFKPHVDRILWRCGRLYNSIEKNPPTNGNLEIQAIDGRSKRWAWHWRRGKTNTVTYKSTSNVWSDLSSFMR
jgi:hypothetical protein